AADGATVAVDEDKRLDVRDNRLHRQTASVHVGSERAADGQSVGTGLLLRDRPRAMIDEILDQLRPFDSGLHFDDSALAIEMQNIVHGSDRKSTRLNSSHLGISY